MHDPQWLFWLSLFFLGGHTSSSYVMLKVGWCGLFSLGFLCFGAESLSPSPFSFSAFEMGSN